ncbi:MAG: hypothetical protein OXU20_11100, partial [Myxococcales bacterium]|nr:hypothetical protein [Myxococcales bacterium]
MKNSLEWILVCAFGLALVACEVTVGEAPDGSLFDGFGDGDGDGDGEGDGDGDGDGAGDGDGDGVGDLPGL